MKLRDYNYEMRSAKSSYIVLCGPFLALACYGGYSTWHQGAIEFYKSVLTCLIMALLFFAWIASFKLTLTPESLTYGQLFRRTRTIKFGDIVKAGRYSGLEKFTNSMDGMNRLLIWSKANPKEPYIAINLKMFKAQDVKRLINTLKPYM